MVLSSMGRLVAQVSPRVLVDFVITKQTEGLQKLVLDLAAAGYQVRCSLWPQTEGHRVWPEVEPLARPLEIGEELEKIGIRLSHADSFDSLLTQVKVGLTLWEETAPRSPAELFQQVDGLLASTRAGSQRLRQLGVTVPIEPLSPGGLQQILAGKAGGFTSPLTADPALARSVRGLVEAAARVSVLVLANNGEDANTARFAAIKLCRDHTREGGGCAAICLAVHSGPPIAEDGILILGQHHLLPMYHYLAPPAALVEADLLLGIRDLLTSLAVAPNRNCEVFGLLRFEDKLLQLLEECGFTCRVHERPVVGLRPAPRRVGIAGPFNVACGLAEEARLLCEASPRPLVIFSERVNQEELLATPDLAVRCYRRGGESYGEWLQEIVRHGIDVLHVEYNHGVFEPVQLSSLLHHLRTIGVRTVGTLHAATKDTVSLAAVFDQVIANSEEAKERLMAGGIPRDRVQVIPLPVRPLVPVSRQAAREQLGVAGGPVIATCGFALPHKGLLELLFAIAHLRTTYPEIRLLLCTPPYPHSAESASYLDECHRTVGEWGIGEHVRFATDFLPMEQLGPWLQSADLLAFPYTSGADQDASGAVRMALNAGVPVIVSDLEIFADLRDAVYRALPGHIPSLTRGIREVLEKQSLRGELTKSASRLAQKWQPSEIARRHWCEVYRAFGDVPVHLEGCFQSDDSFAQMLVNLALTLRDMGCDVSIDPWRAGEETTALPQALTELAAKPTRSGLTIRACYPHRPEGVKGKDRALILPWEVSLLPAGLAEVVNSEVDHVLVPSRFCQQAVLDSGVDAKLVKYFPLGVDRNRFNPRAKPTDLGQVARAALYSRPDLELDPKSLFVFLHLGCAAKRKGSDLLLEAYCEEFTGKDPVLLLVKSFGNGDVHDWAKQALMRTADPPRLLYLRDDVPGPLLPGYYAASDCLVHPCRGEGFGLTVLEAMACGRPAIVTNWSGPVDFCDEDNAYLLDYRLVPASEFHLPVPPEAVWAEPDRPQLRALMRHAMMHRDEVRSKGLRASEDAQEWNWARSAYQVLDATGWLRGTEGRDE